jgi:hypothetical protein
MRTHNINLGLRAYSPDDRPSAISPILLISSFGRVSIDAFTCAVTAPAVAVLAR